MLKIIITKEKRTKYSLYVSLCSFSFFLSTVLPHEPLKNEYGHRLRSVSHHHHETNKIFLAQSIEIKQRDKCRFNWKTHTHSLYICIKWIRTLLWRCHPFDSTHAYMPSAFTYYYCCSCDESRECFSFHSCNRSGLIERTTIHYVILGVQQEFSKWHVYACLSNKCERGTKRFTANE